MKNIFSLLLLISVFSFTQLVPINTNAQTPNYKKLDSLFNLLETHDKIMGSIAVMKDGNIVYKKSIGYQFIKDNKKFEITNKSKYRVGSITKMFTSVIIFQLVDEGKISISETLLAYFPEVPNASKITIANLLNHSSGLYNITNSENFGDWYQNKTNTTEMLSRIIKTETVFEPGERNEYSNTNYLLLGYIIEKIEGTSYSQILKNRVLTKLDLKNTYYGSTIDISNNECKSYTYENEEWTISTETHMSLPHGAGAIVSNSADLTTFITALFNGKLMSAKSFEYMTTSTKDFGSGIFKMPVNGTTVYGHEGGIDGFQSMLIYIPEYNTAIAITLNAVNYGLVPIILKALAISIGEDFEMPVFTKITLTEEEVKQFAGVYASDDTFFDLVFEANGTILKGAPEGSNLKELVCTKKNQFTFDTLQIILDFDPEEGTVIFTKGEDAPILFYKQ